MAMAMTEEDFVSDLQITMEAPFAVYPAEPTPRRSMFLSNIDQTLVSTVATITFFPACAHMAFDEILQRYVDALGKLLVHYDFVAGRLALNEDEDRLEIDCNGAGVFFAVGMSDLTVEELKDIKFPNPAFRQLILQDYVSQSHLQDLPLFTLQEKDIAAAAGKLAECQETILVLSKQLKALACPVDTMEFPYEAEKRAERDQRYELDAPWSPHSQSASWASEPENISTAKGRVRASEWTSESGLAASDLYKVNVPDSPIVDYLDGRLTMHTYSDTEESSPAGSPMKSTQQRNKFTCFS